MVDIVFLSFYGADYCCFLFAAASPTWYAASSVARSCQTARSWKSRESDLRVSSVGTRRCSFAMSSRTLSIGRWRWLFVHHIHALVRGSSKSNAVDFRCISRAQEWQHSAGLGVVKPSPPHAAPMHSGAHDGGVGNERRRILGPQLLEVVSERPSEELHSVLDAA
jgi:hypothetical protein